MHFRSLFVFSVFAVLWGACGGGENGESAPNGISPDTLAVWMEDGRTITLLDTQPDSVFDAEHLPGAIRAYGLRIPDLREVLPRDPGVPIVVYNSDGASPPAGQDLARQAVGYGFSEVYWLDGGVKSWKGRGYNVDGFRLFPRP